MAVAEAPFKIVTDWISFGFKVDSGPGLPAAAIDSIGTPSITYKGSLLA